MRTGPKFEITKEMALSNLLAIAERLGIRQISQRLYIREGSFSLSAIIRKFHWNSLVCEAGLMYGTGGRPKRIRRVCLQCGLRQSRTISRTCPTCERRINANSAGAMDEDTY